MKKKIYIILFSLLYVCTAIVSTVHAVSFFQLANVMWMGVMLAATFEIGQAAVLFSLLNSKAERSKVMPWTLMSILTAVQIMGNVFSSYKYLMLNSSADIQYFTEPILFFLEPGDPMIRVILTYIIGAILPIVALCMTGMISNYLEDERPVEVLEGARKTTPEETPEEPVDVSGDTAKTSDDTEDNDILRETIFK